MGSLNPSKPSLDCGFSSTIGDFLTHFSTIHNASEKISKLNDCVNRLQNEMNKIDAFKRELPLCMLLLENAIVKMKDELSKCTELNAEPVLEEFIPLKNKSVDEKKFEKIEDSEEDKDINNGDKMNWLSSVQLWNSDDLRNTDYNPTLKMDTNKKRKEEDMNGDSLFPSAKIRTVGRAFVPFKGSNLPGLSLCMPEIKNSKDDEVNNNTCGFTRSWTSSAINGQSNSRKQRRCWSAELHQRFVSALEQLGGPQVATPKQIRELMQVEGLTNDEVKSHLQKYRLHSRKALEHSNNNSQSGSPEGPLQLARSYRASTTSMAGDDDILEDDEDEDD